MHSRFLKSSQLHTALKCLLLFLFAYPMSVYADKVATDKWIVAADKVTRYEDPRSIVAEGNVVLEKNEKVVPKSQKPKNVSSWSELLEEKNVNPDAPASQVEKSNEPQYRTAVTIRADWIVYDVELESIKAKGNVRITTQGEQLFAKEATLSLTKETGKFINATIIRKELSLHLEGKSIEKTGYDTYRIEDGWVITCKLEDGQSPPWSISSSNTEVTKGGYAVMKNAMFNIMNVPVFYTPFMILPAKDTRQSGFLPPAFSYSSRSGAGFDFPFFLNISDSADFTFYPQVYSNRGIMPGAEFRYATSLTNKGMFTATYLNDSLSDPTTEAKYYNETGYTHDNNERYWIRGKANYTLNDVIQTRLDIDIASDQDFLSEFSGGINGFDRSQSDYLSTFGRGFQNQTDTQRQNSFKALYTHSGMALETNFLAIQEDSTTAGSTYTPLWKLPGVSFSGAQSVWDTNLSFNWHSSYVNYWREDGIGGQRLDLNPAISAPIPINPYLETLAEVILHETAYYVQTFGSAEWDNDTTENRFLPEVKSEVATTLERDFKTGEGETDGFTHQIRPYVKYQYIPSIDQTMYPQMDATDTILGVNTITYGVDNLFNSLAAKGVNKGGVWDTASIQIEEGYSLKGDAEEPFLPITTKIGVAPFQHTKFTYKAGYDVYDNEFVSHSFGGAYASNRGDLLMLDYSYHQKSTYYDEIQQINAAFRANLMAGWIATGGIQHSFSLDETIKANGGVTYITPCWSVTFETHYTPTDTTFVVLFSLANIGSPLEIGF